MQKLTEDATVDFNVNITGSIFKNHCLTMDAREISIKEIARQCRIPFKRGGGCPVGVMVACPFKYPPYMERHKGEPPVTCYDVTAEDWIELFELIDEED